jgi:hypothetical protein
VSVDDTIGHSALLDGILRTTLRHLEDVTSELLRLAAELWVDGHGHEEYSPGTAGLSVGWMTAAERAYSVAHKARYPERWQH